MTTAANQYHAQAEEFLASTGTKVAFEYLGHDSRMLGVAVPTAHFRVTVERAGRSPWVLDFSDSQHDSYEWAKDDRALPKWGPRPQSVYGKVETTSRRTPDDAERGAARTGTGVEWAGYRVRQRVPQPHAYDLLACIQKSDPGSFTDFCSDFGYSNDSTRARDTFIAVVEEWQNVKRMFSEAEIERLGEIQ